MRILLISFSFPPAGGVGVMRALSLAKYLPEYGCEVEVLTARNAPAVGSDVSLARQIPERVKVHRTWTIDLPFGLRKAIKKLVAKPGTDQKVGEASRPHAIKRIIADMLLPDPQIGWLPFAKPAAVKIVRERKIDLVLITVPPFSCALLVSHLRKHFPCLPIVLEFRDEWLRSTIDLVSYSKSAKARQVALRTEENALRDATMVVTVTRSAEETLRARYPQQPSEKFVCVPNGFDRELAATTLRKTMDRKNICTLTYIGTLYGSTDPTPLIEAIKALPPEMRSRVRLRFIGRIEVPAYRDGLLALGPLVELVGFLPQAEALQAMEETDYLLLISHDPINVSAKLYEYLSGGKPILAAVDPSGEIRRILDETQAGLWADVRNVSSLQKMLHDVIEEKLTIPEPRRDVIAGYHRRSLTRAYASRLRGLVPRSCA